MTASAPHRPNALPVVLLYSLLLPYVEDAGGTEERLVEQLGSDYGIHLREALDSEEDWDEDALWGAVGEGAEAKQALCESLVSVP